MPGRRASRPTLGRVTIKRWSWLVAALLVIVGAALLQPFEFARSGANRVVGAVVLVVAAVFIANLLLAGRAEISRMRRSIDRAQEIVSGRAEIAQMVAHEVRGPVTTIRGLAETSIRHYERLGDP